MESDMELETLRPNPVWDASVYDDAVSTLAERADDIVVKVWCGDWCKDCRAQLPDFGAALQAAEVPADHIEQYPVEKADGGSKVGPLVEEYDISRIPTVVIEDAASGRELARFVEEADEPIAVYLADRLTD